MNKEAFDLVNSTVEKIAGIKDVLNGTNVRRAINDVKGGAAVVRNFERNLKHIDPSARQATREAIGRMKGDLTRMKGRVALEGAKTVGAYAAPIAAGAFVAKKISDNKKEKTASDIVNEVFEKISK